MNHDGRNVAVYDSLSCTGSDNTSDVLFLNILLGAGRADPAAVVLVILLHNKGCCGILKLCLFKHFLTVNSWNY